jgi:hypothetical protein
VVLTLDPPIGRVVVRLTAQGTTLSAVVVSRDAATLSALRAAEGDVLTALGRSGHSVTNLRLVQVAPARRSEDRPKEERRKR